MAYVPVPKDLSKIKTKLAFNLTKRQLVCFSSAAAVGLPAYLFSPWQYREQCRHVPDDRPHAPVLLSGYV